MPTEIFAPTRQSGSRNGPMIMKKSFNTNQVLSSQPLVQPSSRSNTSTSPGQKDIEKTRMWYSNTINTAQLKLITGNVQQ